MDPNEMVRHAPEILKGGAALAGAFKFTDVIKALLGPATGEVAERIRDEVRLYRFVRQFECLKKAEKMVTKAGFTPRAVPIKLLFPLLEGASLEENEDLHTMWAALLANASLPGKVEKVRPAYIAILKQMAPDEALLLKGIAELTGTDYYREFLLPPELWSKKARDSAGGRRRVFQADLRSRFRTLEHEDPNDWESRLDTCIGLLENTGLVNRVDTELLLEVVLLSSLGTAFLECCEPPKSSCGGKLLKLLYAQELNRTSQPE
jgi:hypothetical protein